MGQYYRGISPEYLAEAEKALIECEGIRSDEYRIQNVDINHQLEQL